MADANGQSTDVIPADKAPTADEAEFLNELRGIPSDILKWLKGQTSKEPACLDMMMDHAAAKINIVLAVIVVNRLASIDRMLRAMNILEEDTLNPVHLATMEPGKKVSLLKSLDKNLSEFLDFARKFVAQNQELFERRHPADELAVLLRAVDPIILRKLVAILKEKGAALTEADVGSALRKPTHPILAELVK